MNLDTEIGQEVCSEGHEMKENTTMYDRANGWRTWACDVCRERTCVREESPKETA